MAYSTLADMVLVKWERVLLQLCPTGDPPVVDAAVVSEAIAQADGLVDIYLSKRFTTPLTAPVPAAVKHFSLAIALYFLYGRESGAPDDVRKRYEDAIALLEKIAANELGLSSALGGASVEPPFGQVDLYTTRKMTMNAFGDSDEATTT